MEPNKLDNEIKQKLAQRTINPSPMAWDRLDAMLSIAEQAPAKKKPNRTWMYMAACFLALLLAGTFFLNQSNKDSNDIDNTNTVVTKGQPAGQKSQQMPNAATPLDNTLPGAVAGVQGSSSSINNQRQQGVWVNATPFHPLPDGHTTQQTGTQTNQNLQATQQTATSSGSRITVDPNALLAEVSTPKPNTAKAMQPKVKVDANVLLSGIEGEMESNFRDRMLDRLAKNYNEVKDAVATRNYN
ncbi:MAG: hypothetical protein V4581_14260 [Bacteroidota bacterium]